MVIVVVVNSGGGTAVDKQSEEVVGSESIRQRGKEQEDVKLRALSCDVKHVIAMGDDACFGGAVVSVDGEVFCNLCTFFIVIWW